MFSESTVTEIYCLSDDFCKKFVLQQEKHMIKDKKKRYRNKSNRTNDAEVMVILILFHLGDFAASSIITKGMYANISDTCSWIRFPITVS